MDRRKFLVAGIGFLWVHLIQAGSGSKLLVFDDVAARAGIQFKHEANHTSQKYLPETMGAGVAMLDYDNDGSLDLFFVNGAALRDPMEPGQTPDKSDRRFWNRLFHNNGDGTFTDTTERAGVRGQGYGMGAAVGDYNQDGFPDLYVTNFGRNILYRNNGDGTFTDITEQAGVGVGGWSAGACFVDYDRDGRLDLVVTRYLDWDFTKNVYCGERTPGHRSYCHPDHFPPARHVVYRNSGEGTFRDVSKQCGIGAAPGKGLGIAINDFDGDGWPDILVANDSFAQQLFRNNRDGTFSELALALGLAFNEDGKTFAGMGVGFADYDNDGWPDVFVNALANERYALFRNQHGESFDYVSGPSGIGAISMLHSGWGAGFLDYDNDGWKDLFVGQGHVMDNIQLTQPSVRYLEPPLLMRNNGGKFHDVSEQSGAPFHAPLAARGVAFGDLNNDGFLDIAINCNNGPALVLQNQDGNGNHWLLVKLVGSRSNRDGIGARLRLVSESGKQQFAIASTAGSYLSANDSRVHFGLGVERAARLLEISWPSGSVQRLEKVDMDQVLTVREPES